MLDGGDPDRGGRSVPGCYSTGPRPPPSQGVFAQYAAGAPGRGERPGCCGWATRTTCAAWDRRASSCSGPSGSPSRRPVRRARLGGVADRPQAVRVPDGFGKQHAAAYVAERRSSGRLVRRRSGSPQEIPSTTGSMLADADLAGFPPGLNSRAASDRQRGPGSPGGLAMPPRPRSPGRGWISARAGDRSPAVPSAPGSAGDLAVFASGGSVMVNSRPGSPVSREDAHALAGSC